MSASVAGYLRVVYPLYLFVFRVVVAVFVAVAVAV